MDKINLLLKIASVMMLLSFLAWLIRPVNDALGLMDSNRKKRIHSAIGFILISFIPLSSMIPRAIEFIVCLLGATILLSGLVLHLRLKRK